MIDIDSLRMGESSTGYLRVHLPLITIFVVGGDDDECPFHDGESSDPLQCICSRPTV